jgi:hypothetical protein
VVTVFGGGWGERSVGFRRDGGSRLGAMDNRRENS